MFAPEIDFSMLMSRMHNIHWIATKSLLMTVIAMVLSYFLLPGFSYSQERVSKVGSGEYSYDFKVFFPVDVARFSPDYLENPVTLAKLDSVIAVHGTDLIDSLVVIAQSSPEGPYAHNVDLANGRAASMRDYLTSHFPGLEGKIRVQAGVAPWPASRAKADLVRLRYAAFRLVFPFDITIPVPSISEDLTVDENLYGLDLNDEILLPEESLDVEIPTYDESYKQTIFALKTNLLFDLATALNVELEIPIGRRMSIMWEDVFPWWETGNKYCFQNWQMGPELRYWFTPWDVHGTDKLRGFFVGAYGMSAKGDLQNDRKFDYQYEYWSAGLTGGWSARLGRRNWGRLELSLGLGYANVDYRHYLPMDDYSKLIRDPYDVGTASFWGPTKAKVSLVIPVNVTRNKKGGSK